MPSSVDDKKEDSLAEPTVLTTVDALELGAEGAVKDTQVQLISEDDGIVLIPQPSRNPNDPLNIPEWLKWINVFILGLFSVMGVLLASGMGAFTGLMYQEYRGDKRVNDLLIWPTLFMGIGNAIAMPLALACGRRPVFLGSVLLMTFTAMGCALTQSIEAHLAVRSLMSLAAGQTEALVPMMVQEMNYLHARSSRLGVVSGIQTIGFSVLMVATGPITQRLGWRWWYGICAIISGGVLVTGFFLTPETKFHREASTEPYIMEFANANPPTEAPVYTTKRLPELDLVRFPRRTLLQNLKPYEGPSEWKLARQCLVEAARCFLYPNVFWLVLMNSLALSAYVIMTTEFARPLTMPPYNFSYDEVGYVLSGQLFAAIVFIPLMGWGGDWFVKQLAKRNGGNHKPEFRLIPVIIPVVAAIVSCIVYGRTLADPFGWSWAGIAVPLNAVFFSFMGIILVSYTYSIDTYADRAGPILLLYCCMRGIISFVVSLKTVEFFESGGPVKAMNVVAILFGAVSACGIPIYFFGPQIRRFTQRY